MPVKLGGGGGGLGGTFTEVIMTSQTYTVPYTARMTIWAIGGGGGGVACITSSGVRFIPGGAAGGLACSELPVTAGDQFVLTIGASGSGATRSNYVNTTYGGAGGTTTVTGPGIASNAVLTATGGASGNTTTGGVGTNGNIKNTTGGAAGTWAGSYAPDAGNWAFGGGAVGLGANGSVGNTPPRYVWVGEAIGMLIIPAEEAVPALTATYTPPGSTKEVKADSNVSEIFIVTGLAGKDQ